MPRYDSGWLSVGQKQRERGMVPYDQTWDYTPSNNLLSTYYVLGSTGDSLELALIDVNHI